MSNLEEAKDQREIFAEDLKRLVDTLLTDPRQPAALFVHIHYEDRSLVRAYRQKPGFSRMQAIGAMECEKNQLINAVISGEK